MSVHGRPFGLFVSTTRCWSHSISMLSRTVDHTLFGGSGNSLPVDWSSLQLKDAFFDHVLTILHRTQSLDQLRSDNAEFVWMFRERSRLVLKDGVLYRQRTVENNEKLYFMPNSQGFHNELGHLSRDKTLDLICQQFCWPGMEKDVIGALRENLQTHPEHLWSQSLPRSLWSCWPSTSFHQKRGKVVLSMCL